MSSRSCAFQSMDPLGREADVGRETLGFSGGDWTHGSEEACGASASTA